MHKTMLKFEKLTIDDRTWVNEILKSENSRYIGYNFGNIYMWEKKYPHLAARFGDWLIMRSESRSHCYSFPFGVGDVRPVLEAELEYAMKCRGCFCMQGITEAQRQTLENEYPGRFEFEANSFFAEYLYSAEKLSSYSGKALHSKKNHCNRFEAEHQWQFVPLTRQLMPDCLAMFEDWASNGERPEEGVDEEYDAILRGFEEYERLELDGGVLYADGRIAGFSVGEMTCEDTFDVHFEKAEMNINGAFPIVCREMTRMVMKKYPALKYINREEDMDIEALRFSKQSYKPEMILPVYDARWKK